MKSKGLDLVIVDYLQLVQADKNRKDRRLEIEDMTRTFKILAKELEVPVICLSQLNRSSEDRLGNRPRMSDLRESGSIEQDADEVLLLYRPEDDGQPAEIIVAKQRNGPTGVVRAVFHKSYARFENLAEEGGIG
jgi:replicative DNA helicase